MRIPPPIYIMHRFIQIYGASLWEVLKYVENTKSCLKRDEILFGQGDKLVNILAY